MGTQLTPSGYVLVVAVEDSAHGAGGGPAIQAVVAGIRSLDVHLAWHESPIKTTVVQHGDGDGYAWALIRPTEPLVIGERYELRIDQADGRELYGYLPERATDGDSRVSWEVGGAEDSAPPEWIAEPQVTVETRDGVFVVVSTPIQERGPGLWIMATLRALSTQTEVRAPIVVPGFPQRKTILLPGTGGVPPWRLRRGETYKLQLEAYDREGQHSSQLREIAFQIPP